MGPSGLRRGETPETQFADRELGSEAVGRLRAAFGLAPNPMLLADDHRRWVTGNGAACKLLGVPPEEVAWHTMSEFTPPAARARLEEQWELFLASGSAEGWHELYFPERGAVPVELCATANVFPSRHLAVFLLPDESDTDAAMSSMAREAAWKPILAPRNSGLELTGRERQTLTLIASGLQTIEIARRLFLSPETVKSHAHSAMVKLGAHTRAGAVATALVTGQIGWSSASPAPVP